MAAIPGLRVTGTLVPTDTADKYPVTDPDYQIGGWRAVTTIAERNAIPAERRRIGTTVYITGTGETWALLGGIADGNWTNVTPTTGGGSGVTDGDKGVITVVGGVWNFDPAVVTPAAQTVLDDPTVAAMVTTLGAAPLASPAFTGDPTAPSQAKTDNSTKLATTGHVKTVVADYAPLASPALTGAPTAPTAVAATNTTQLATTAFVKNAIDALVTGAPGTMDTLDEIAQALGDDPNFAATMTTQLAGKLNNSIAQDRIWTRTGAGTGVVEEIVFSPFMRGLADDANAAAARTTLELLALATKSQTAAGDYVAGSIAMGDLASINQYSFFGRTATGSGPPTAVVSSTNAYSMMTAANYAAMRTLLSLVPGTDVLAFDTYLDALRGATNAVATFPWRNAAGVAAAHALSVLADTLLASNSPAAWRNAINRGVTPLTDGTTISTDCAVDNVFQVTLGGTPRTLANPTNVVVGATYVWFIIQDGSGGRPLTLGSNFKLGVDSAGAAVTYTPSTAAGAVDMISAVARSTTSLATAILKGVQ